MKIAKTENVMTINNSSAAGIILGIALTILGILILTKTSVFASTQTWVGYAFLAGILVVLFVKSVKITINKDASTVTVFSKSIVKKSTEEYKFSDIDRVEMRMFKKKENRNRNNSLVSLGTVSYSFGYQFFLMTQKGEEIDIQGGNKISYPKPVFERLHEKNKQIADNVATFIGIPVAEVDNTSELAS
ncbi:MAG: hypothetical protein WCI57_05345 [Candidatus Berkelbacteria bacterium]